MQLSNNPFLSMLLVRTVRGLFVSLFLVVTSISMTAFTGVSNPSWKWCKWPKSIKIKQCIGLNYFSRQAINYWQRFWSLLSIATISMENWKSCPCTEINCLLSQVSVLTILQNLVPFNICFHHEIKSHEILIWSFDRSNKVVVAQV